MSKVQRFNFTYQRLGEDLTITNAGIDKQKTLKRDYIDNIENTDLEIGVSGVFYVNYNILNHVDAPGRLAHFMRYASTF